MGKNVLVGSLDSDFIDVSKHDARLLDPVSVVTPCTTITKCITRPLTPAGLILCVTSCVSSRSGRHEFYWTQ